MIALFPAHLLRAAEHIAMTTQYYTYFYFDPKDGTPIYVGKGSNKRAWAHQTRCYQTNIQLKRTLAKRRNEGFNPTPVIWNMPSEKEALQLEVFWIAYYGRADQQTGSLFNLTDGGENPPSSKGIKRSVETRQKIREANTGKIKGPPSEETIEKIRKANIGRKQTPDAIRKQSESMIGKNVGKIRSAETKAKLSASSARRGKPSLMKGKPMSEEAKAKQKATWERKRMERMNDKDNKKKD